MRQDDEEKIKAAQLEYDIVKDLKHPNIMEAYDFYEDKLRNTTYTVFELVEGSSI